jgi:ABC-2 type transport system ATP-binding protein
VGTEASDQPEGRSVVVRTTDLQGSLASLLAWSGSRGLALGDLNARSASLEEAFLAVAESATDDDPEVAA